MPNLSDIGTIKDILKRHQFSFSKALGQNFLVNPCVCPRMAQACAAPQGEGVLEIGPGIGVLTQELSACFQKVVCFEVDTRLLPVLAETLSDCPNVFVRNEDFLKADLEKVLQTEFSGMRVSVCANLPYYITSPILMCLLESRLPLDNITVMVQKEAADRICAEPGTKLSGALTAAVHYYATAEKLFSVSRGSFMPAPNVDSAVIQLHIRQKPPVQVADEAFFFRVIQASFAQRRKTAVNSLSAGLGVDKADIAALLQSLGMDERVRAETFTLQDFADISNRLYKG
ncbi:MAG: 16S rRNA (adenine(1518)-N(6)/adenine(1519)-N(6))-dimethyltransferase RsmA [Acutalibacteraceae bacterium]